MNVIGMQAGMRERAHRSLQMHSVWLWVSLTTAEEKLSKVIGWA